MIHHISNDIKTFIIIFLVLLFNCSDNTRHMNNEDLHPKNKFYRELAGRIDFFVQSKLIEQDKRDVLSRHLASLKNKGTIKDLKAALKAIPKLKRVSPYINGRIHYLLGLKEYREVKTSFHLPITQRETVFAVIEGLKRGLQHAKLLPKRIVKTPSILFTHPIANKVMKKQKKYKKKSMKRLSRKRKYKKRRYHRRKSLIHKTRSRRKLHRKTRSRVKAKKVSKYLVPPVYSPGRDRM